MPVYVHQMKYKERLVRCIYSRSHAGYPKRPPLCRVVTGYTRKVNKKGLGLT